MKRHFLQSSTWAEYERLEGHEVFTHEGEEFAFVAVKYQTPLGAYLYCPYGPSLSDKLEPGVAMKLALDSLVKLAREQKVFFVRVEPTVEMPIIEMKKLGLKKSHNLQPAHTWVVDLTGTKEDFLNKIEKDRVRRWRNLAKKGITIRQTKDPDEVDVLIELLNKLGEAREFTPQNREHLANQMKAGFATLYIAELQEGDAEGVKTQEEAAVSGSVATKAQGGAVAVKPVAGKVQGETGGAKPIAAALVHDYDGVRYAMHAAADDDYRNLRAGIAVEIQKMLDAQEAGMREFDFWGITTSDDPKHPWYGFTKYKKSFVGRQVDYAGTWDFPLNKVKYWLYGIIRRVNRRVRKGFQGDFVGAVRQQGACFCGYCVDGVERLFRYGRWRGRFSMDGVGGLFYYGCCREPFCFPSALGFTIFYIAISSLVYLHRHRYIG